MSNPTTSPSDASKASPIVLVALGILFAAILIPLYRRSAAELYDAYTLVDSYYTHGPIVPLISLFFAYRLWPKARAVAKPAPFLAIFFILIAIASLLTGDFLGFRIFTEVSLIPMVVALVLLFMGIKAARIWWFPILFLFFMIPIPASITQSISLRLKLFAAEASVQLANLITLPLVREGSFIYWPGDQLIIGDVCGGLRSLIALLALGAIMGYISQTRPVARWLIFAIGAPIAIVSNIARIFFLCVVGYNYGSEVAAGKVHDYSGVLIFVVAFALFLVVDTIMRRLFSIPESTEAPPAPERPPFRIPKTAFVALAMIVAGLVAHLSIVSSQATAVAAQKNWEGLDIPDYVGNFDRFGIDEGIDERTRALLETSEILIRPYRHKSGYPVTLTIVYAGTTRRSLHFPEVCLVGAGWEVREQGSEPLDFNLTSTKLHLVRDNREQAVLYWFKTGENMTGNYFENAYHWATNQLTRGTATSAMIKVSCQVQPGREDMAYAVLKDFSLSFMPIAMERIP